MSNDSNGPTSPTQTTMVDPKKGRNKILAISILVTYYLFLFWNFKGLIDWIVKNIVLNNNLNQYIGIEIFIGLILFILIPRIIYVNISLESSSKITNWVMGLLVLTIISLLIINIFIYNSDAIENRETVIDETDSSFKKLIDNFTCMLNPVECQKEREETQQAQTSDRTDPTFNLDLNKKQFSAVYTLKDLNVPIIIEYKVESPSDGITIKNLSCYYNKKIPNFLFDTIKFETEEKIDKNARETNQYECYNDPKMLPNIIMSNEDKVKIITELTYSIINTISIQIPILDYDTNSNSGKKTSSLIQKEYLDKNSVENLVNNNPSTPNIELIGVKLKLPLIVGDDRDEKFSGKINIDTDVNRDYGEIVGIEAIEITDVSSLRITNKEELIGNMFISGDDRATLNLEFKEDDNLNLNQDEAIQTIEIKLRTTFVKTDYNEITYKFSQKELDSLVPKEESTDDNTDNSNTNTQTATSENPTSESTTQTPSTIQDSNPDSIDTNIAP